MNNNVVLGVGVSFLLMLLGACAGPEVTSQQRAEWVSVTNTQSILAGKKMKFNLGSTRITVHHNEDATCQYTITPKGKYYSPVVYDNDGGYTRLNTKGVASYFRGFLSDGVRYKLIETGATIKLTESDHTDWSQCQDPDEVLNIVALPDVEIKVLGLTDNGLVPADASKIIIEFSQPMNGVNNFNSNLGKMESSWSENNTQLIVRLSKSLTPDFPYEMTFNPEDHPENTMISAAGKRIPNDTKITFTTSEE